jgi:hypothetical protein
MGGDFRLRDACVGKERAEFIRVPQHEGRTQPVGGFFAKKPLQEFDHRGVTGRRVERVPDGDGQTATGTQHAHHFPEGGAAVFKIHQPELAHHCIKAVILEWERLCLPLPPFNLRSFTSGDGQHPLVHINADDCCATLGDGTRHDTCATRHIQHALAGLNMGGVGQTWCLFPEQRRDEEFLIDFGSTTYNLSSISHD